MKEEKPLGRHPISAERIQAHRDNELGAFGLSAQIVEGELGLGVKSGQISQEVVDAMNVY